MRIAWLAWCALGCGGSSGMPPRPEAPATPTAPTPAAYQQRFGGLSVRDGDRLVDAPAAIVAIVRGYPSWPHKGVAIDGVSLTLMTAKTDVEPGEPIDVVHVLDVATPGRQVYIMGPKRPANEYLDGKLATVPPEIASYPFVATYDGVTLPSPAIDYNYEVTTYRFATPGRHQIVWQLGDLASNTIVVRVR